MPLQASHIKFSLELKDFFKVENLGKYIAGAVYPDSRYFTKIDRILTHGKDLVDGEFIRDNDFRKGWVSHIISDKAYYEEIKAMFLKESENEDEKWYNVNTAIKIVEDMRCAKNLDMNLFLPFVNLMEIPNGEKEELMKKHISALKKLYGNKILKIEDYAKMLLDAEISDDAVREIVKNARNFLLDKDLLIKLDDLFDNKVISRIKSDWLPKIH